MSGAATSTSRGESGDRHEPLLLVEAEGGRGVVVPPPPGDAHAEAEALAALPVEERREHLEAAARLVLAGQGVPAGAVVLTGDPGELDPLPPARPYGEPPRSPKCDVSASRLGKWSACPEAYARAYGRGGRKKCRPIPGAAAEKGSAAHNALWEAAMARLRSDVPLDAPTKADELLERLERWAPPGGLEHAEAQELLVAAAPFDLSNTIQAELMIVLPIAGASTVLLVDRVDQLGRRIQGVDYKSGAPKTRAELEWDAQACLYLYGLRRAYVEADGWSIRFDYLGSGVSQEVHWTPVRDAFARSLVRSFVLANERDRFEARPSWSNCTRCDYRDSCKAFATWAEAQGQPAEASGLDLGELVQLRHELHSRKVLAEDRLSAIDAILREHLTRGRTIEGKGGLTARLRKRRRTDYAPEVVAALAQTHNVDAVEVWERVGRVSTKEVKKLAAVSEQAALAAEEHQTRGYDAWVEVKEARS